jgi:L-cysteine S-thiosulfotransferase
MKRLLIGAFAALIAAGSPAAFAGPQEDIQALRDYMQERFPDVALANFKNGAYALDEAKAVQWESQRDFPPFLDHLDEGEEIWNTPFANGKTFADCFGDDTSTIRVRYPRWNAETKKVETLEGQIMACQKANGEKPFKGKRGKIAYLSAWLASEANGQVINVVVPANDPDAMAAYEDGKRFFYAKRGQLNMSCADCHVYNSGMQARGNLLSPTVGHTTHFPVWRGKWARATNGADGFGTLQRRYDGCNKQVRAKPFKNQGTEYSNLEFFHQAMSNGQVIDAPDYRE